MSCRREQARRDQAALAELLRRERARKWAEQPVPASPAPEWVTALGVLLILIEIVVLLPAVMP